MLLLLLLLWCWVCPADHSPATPATCPWRPSTIHHLPVVQGEDPSPFATTKEDSKKMGIWEGLPRWCFTSTWFVQRRFPKLCSQQHLQPMSLFWSMSLCFWKRWYHNSINDVCFLEFVTIHLFLFTHENNFVGCSQKMYSLLSKYYLNF